MLKLSDSRSGAALLVKGTAIVSARVLRDGTTVVSVGTQYDLWVRETPDQIYDMLNEEVIDASQ